MKIKYNNSTSSADILLILIAVLFVATIIGLVGFMIYKINNPIEEVVEDNFDPNQIAVSVDGEKLETLEDILKKYRIELLNNEGSRLYVKFPFGYYDENGDSYSSYYYNMLDEISQLSVYETRSYYMYDDEKGMNIEAKYDSGTKKHTYTLNGLENFYRETDGKVYAAVDNSQIADEVEISVTAEEGELLISTNYFFRFIKNKVGEKTGEHGDYDVYKDGAIIMKVVNSKVRNIIFTKDYDQPVVNRYKVGTDLQYLYEKYGSHTSKGSPEEKYLMYRTTEVYVFIYEDQISIWPYTYEEDQPFENYLLEYIENRDLETFYNKVTNRWSNYLKNETDFENGEIHLHYPSMGVMIDIRGNDPKGIKIYNNCDYSTNVKNLLKQGVITFVDEDAVFNAEQERRTSF
jgi:hypothetical protein